MSFINVFDRIIQVQLIGSFRCIAKSAVGMLSFGSGYPEAGGLAHASPMISFAGISSEAVSIIEEVSRAAGSATTMPSGRTRRYLDAHPTRPIGGSTYKAWIQTLAAFGGVSAVRIKLADNEDNSSPSRVASIPEGESLLAKRYRPAREMLEGRLQNVPS